MLQQVVEELRDIAFEPRIVDFPNFQASRQAVIINVEVQIGRYKGQTLAIALSFQEDTYPEYPPHFVHFKSSIRTTIATRHTEHDFEGENWSTYSLPPSDFWDSLEPSQRNMKTYFRRHLLRILAQL